MKFLKKAIAVLCAAVCAAATLSGCSNISRAALVYPDYPNADPSRDSWTQWDEDDKVTIHWYVDLVGWSNNSSSLISDEIYRRTGVNVIFETPADSSGAELSTMMQMNTFTDVISIAANTQERVRLAETEGYIFPIQELARRWAPTLMERLDEEMATMYAASDGNLYGIPNHFYSTQQVEEYSDMGYSLLSNGGIVARKDYLDAYHAAMYELNPDWDPASVCTPQGILDMCLWVKDHFNLKNDNPTVCLAPFESHRTTGSVGLRWLMEYFSVPEEDENGNYVYQYAQPEFEEMMVWLNELYRNGLMTSGNLTATASSIGTYIQNGLPFIYIGSPQDMAQYFKNWNIKSSDGVYNYEGRQYVPIVFGNSDGDVPQISVTGNSYMFSMITNRCERPDRVIQLFDFLYSEEGQRLLAYGTEADGADDEEGTYYYTVQPGESAMINGEMRVAKYGQIEYTDRVKEAFNTGNTTSYGFFSPNVLYNPMYVNLTSVRGGAYNQYVNYVSYNLKAGLIPYTYIYRGFEFELDPMGEDYSRVVDIHNNLRLLWNEYYAEIICAGSAQAAAQIVQDTLASAQRRGYETFIAYKNETFQEYKQKQGITFAWPPNDPDSDYHSLRFTGVYGDSSYDKEIPADVAIR